jgi:hypothetical protein
MGQRTGKMKETDSKHQDDDSFFEQALAVEKQIPYGRVTNYGARRQLTVDAAIVLS